MKKVKENVLTIINKTKSRLGETVVIVLLLLTIVFLLYNGQKNRNNHKIELQEEKNFSTALTDTIKNYLNKNGELVAEKRTLQIDIKRLEDGNITLTENQKRLVNLVKERERENSVLAAAVAKGGILIDSLSKEINELNIIADNSNVDIDDEASNVNFSNNTDPDFQFDLTIRNVKSIQSSIPELKFNSINFPNTQEISFQWEDNRKEGFPISFSISNSNRFYKTLNIDSYSIPELRKQDLIIKPLGKVWNFVKGNGKFIVIGGVGYLLGNAMAK